MPLAHPNHFLRSLAAEDRVQLEPYLRPVQLNVGSVLERAEEQIKHAYFPRTGMMSFVTSFSDGSTIAAAIAGSNTVVGAVGALGGECALTNHTVQIAGVADEIAIEDLTRVAERNEQIRLLLRKHAHALFAQAFQVGACNAIHSVEGRLSRWLLQCRSILQSNTLPITHEFVARMLGVRRTSVTLILGEFQRAGITDCRRGSIQLLDVDGLHNSTCECYDTIRIRVERLTGWLPSLRQTSARGD
jgi:CRP-like cAMP-binding protein